MTDPQPAPQHRVVIVGGGFGGLYAAKVLAGTDVAVTLVDRRNFHLFQPLLYQVASGWLAPSEISVPLRAVFEHDRNIEVLLGEVRDVDLERRRVLLENGEPLSYDTLIVATGSVVDHFGNESWTAQAPGVKTVEDALDIRRRVLLAFEAAEREHDERERAAWLTFVVIGGGSTGVEMAGVLGELSRDVLRGNFRRIDPSRARILLVQSRDHVLPDFGDRLAGRAASDLDRLGVTIRTGTRVTQITPAGVELSHGAEHEWVEARTVIWAAGVQASPLATILAAASGAGPARGGRVTVGTDLTLPGHPEVFVIGDMAAIPRGDGEVPGLASAAMQAGRYAARTILGRLDDGHRDSGPFRYHDRGELATVGRGAAVARLGPLRFDGFLAWLVWVFVHLMYLAGFANRLVVLTRWAWDLVRHERGARLITGTDRLPEVSLPGSPPAATAPRMGRAAATAARRETVRPRLGFGRVRVERAARSRTPRTPTGTR